MNLHHLLWIGLHFGDIWSNDTDNVFPTSTVVRMKKRGTYITLINVHVLVSYH